MKELIPTKLIPILALSIVLPSCSGVLSDTQKSRMTGVAVQPATTAAEARQAVVGSKSPDMANTAPMATGGGAVPAMLGVLIDSAVTSSQESNFKKQYAGQLAIIERQVPINLNKQVTDVTSRVLGSNAFFKPRLKKRANHRVIVKVNRFGLSRVDRSKGEIYLGANINCLVKLTDGGKGKSILSHTVIAESASRYTPRQLSENKQLSGQLINEALQDYGKKLGIYLNKVSQ